MIEHALEDVSKVRHVPLPLTNGVNRTKAPKYPIPASGGYHLFLDLFAHLKNADDFIIQNAHLLQPFHLFINFSILSWI